MTDSTERKPSGGLTRRIPADLRSTETVRAFLSDPLSTVAAMITGALASGHEDMTLAAGHVVQAIFKGRAFTQLGVELDELLKKGKIRPDYAETKYGFPSLVELMKVIDGDATDDEKLRAAKAMFVALNSPDTLKGEEGLRYQLFRVVLNLTGPQIAIVAACYDLSRRGAFGPAGAFHASDWLKRVGDHIGHQVIPLIEQDESVLVRLGLLSDRVSGERTRVMDSSKARLTDLGIKIAELIERYDSAIPKQA